MLGISVYLSDIDTDYIEYASKLGVQYIFTSLHIPEEDLSDLDEKLDVFLNLCEKLNMRIIPDISPHTFEKLNLENNDFKGLKEKGFDTVRLDYGFEDTKLVQTIAKHFKLVLNASLVNGPYIEKLKDAKIDLTNIILMHNFYPRQDTALTKEYFETLNKTHKKYNIETMAFVVGDKIKRLPLYEGLPTLEDHRDVNPYVAGVELIKKYDVDHIFIGDNQASQIHLDYLSKYIQENIITVPCELDDNYHYLYDKEIKIRQDLGPHIIRLALPRKDVVVEKNNHRKKGSIVIDNLLAKRYSGEVQIIKEDIPYTSRSNNIGWVHPDYIDLLPYIDFQTKIMLVPIKR